MSKFALETKLLTNKFPQVKKMITQEQLKETVERKLALRRYL